MWVHNPNTDTPKVIVIPAWIFNHLRRKGLDIMDLLNYAAVRNHLSLEDIAAWDSVNSGHWLAGIALSTQSLDDLFYSVIAHSDCREEFNRRIYSDELFATTMGKGFDVVENVKTRLSNPPMSDESTYEFITYKDTLFLILKEGFLHYLELTVSADETKERRIDRTKFLVTTESNHERRLDFARDYLSCCYAMARIDIVSRLPMYRSYLKLLK